MFSEGGDSTAEKPGGRPKRTAMTKTLSAATTRAGEYVYSMFVDVITCTVYKH